MRLRIFYKNIKIWKQPSNNALSFFVSSFKMFLECSYILCSCKKRVRAYNFNLFHLPPSDIFVFIFLFSQLTKV